VEWDDLKFLLAVADDHSLDAAARSLNVPTLEIERHIRALESALNGELVTRTAGGVVITASGERVVAVARTIKAQLDELAKEIGGAGGELTGRLCVTSTAGFVPRAMRAFERIRPKFPSLAIDVMVSSHVVDLRGKEADIAVRMFKDQQDGLAMDKLGAFGWSLYASPKYLDGRTSGSLEGLDVIGFDGSFSNNAGGRWIAANVPAEKIVMRVGGIRQALDAAAAGRGACIVPCYLATDHDVARVTKDVLATNDAYAVYLADRRKEARMRVVIDALVDLFVREQATFSGT
jgi:DNA-binding transcriptional LysR family regulator